MEVHESDSEVVVIGGRLFPRAILAAAKRLRFDDEQGVEDAEEHRNIPHAVRECLEAMELEERREKRREERRRTQQQQQQQQQQHVGGETMMHIVSQDDLLLARHRARVAPMKALLTTRTSRSGRHVNPPQRDILEEASSIREPRSSSKAELWSARTGAVGVGSSALKRQVQKPLSAVSGGRGGRGVGGGSDGADSDSGERMILSDELGDDEDAMSRSRSDRRRRSRTVDSDEEDESGVGSDTVASSLQASHQHSSLRRRVDAREVTVAQSYGPLLDDLCIRPYGSLFVDFAVEQVPADYATVVGGPAIDLSIVVNSLASGAYSELHALNADVVKVFDNTISYYGRRGIQDPMSLASKARTLKNWWIAQVALRTHAVSLNVSNKSHYSTVSRLRVGGVRSSVSNAKTSSDIALQVVVMRRARFAREVEAFDGIITEQLQQGRDEYERELLHAERVLLNNTRLKSYLRNGPFELFDSSDALHSIGLMDKECNYCHAMRFSAELPTFCCDNGRINLLRRADPPPVLRALIEDDGHRG